MTIKSGTTANLCDYYKEVGKIEFDSWYTNKVCMLEELAEIGFTEAFTVLESLNNSYNWVMDLENK